MASSFEAWFKIGVSVIDSEGLEMYWSQCINLVLADTKIKMKKLKKIMKYYINYKILYFVVENICNLVNQDLIKKIILCLLLFK